MEVALIFVIGLMLGLILGYAGYILIHKPKGNLIVNETDPDGPYLFLELEEDPEKLKESSRIIFKIVSQK